MTLNLALCFAQGTDIHIYGCQAFGQQTIWVTNVWVIWIGCLCA